MEPVSVVSKRIEGDRLIVELSFDLGALKADFSDPVKKAPPVRKAPPRVVAASNNGPARKCVICHGSIVGMRSDAKYCSASCRQQGWLMSSNRDN